MSLLSAYAALREHLPRAALAFGVLAVVLAVRTPLTALTGASAAGLLLGVLLGLAVATLLLTPILRRQRAVLARMTRPDRRSPSSTGRQPPGAGSARMGEWSSWACRACRSVCCAAPRPG